MLKATCEELGIEYASTTFIDTNRSILRVLNRASARS